MEMLERRAWTNECEREVEELPQLDVPEVLLPRALSTRATFDFDGVEASEPLVATIEHERPRAHDIVGPYGALVATMAADPSTAVRVVEAPRGIRERVESAVSVVPSGVWNRMSVYSCLALLLGNLFLARGLSAGTNVAGALLALIGFVGASRRHVPH